MHTRADPTTLEVLDLLIDRMRTVPLLVVLIALPGGLCRPVAHSGESERACGSAEAIGDEFRHPPVAPIGASEVAFRRR
jgi:hypothetical protein